MTEAEWLASEDPAAMLRAVPRVDGEQVADGPFTFSDRKLRLFACAATRLAGSRGSEPVAAAEAWADGGPKPDNLERWIILEDNAVWVAFDVANPRWGAAFGPDNPRVAQIQTAKAALLRDIVGNPFRPVTPFWRTRTPGGPTLLIGEKAYITPQVLTLAEAAYSERLPDGTLDPLRLAILSDALEEAGLAGEKCSQCDGTVMQEGDRGGVIACRKCDMEGIIPHPLVAHLRSPGPHWRGCWALDLVLGKS